MSDDTLPQPPAGATYAERLAWFDRLSEEDAERVGRASYQAFDKRRREYLECEFCGGDITERGDCPDERCATQRRMQDTADQHDHLFDSPELYP